MKRQIRRGVFETNSSSVHSLTMCSKTDFDRWVNGELLYHRWGDCLVESTEERLNDENREYITYEQFNDWEIMDFETFEQTHTTDTGEEVIGFGYFGHD